ncbi:MULTISPECIES: DUF3813 domain-containing protein [Alkalihalophilus]|jgi:flagellin-like hook-associated protein FlgL|uniref:DUF3813 domain-containing protein n=3 Tax=Alkalihalophilus TaxID=2893060 RepID=D3FVJ6_ALKPO|nr:MULTISPECIES: DUF3813 domain-containing protein [Alkalihalophilus]ADC48511.1 hypothetical protein BpOF4_02220 [Alkalihalophilus pseudofirmus OF4]ERN52703.1 hypothetical protein A33I_14845 [Alkalihalophilus marmarensis DSM 21297]MCM3488072.1 DUF3813 domain-containing protein [Alkalihalophilus marmarensis]MDV2885690.1 DUF3813 domain-containing protein [Alkalihalophilus pseudofirmus]MEC2071499.1 DUF3813 domain-containing protein [Alkalihalophilus marmarensis]
MGNMLYQEAREAVARAELLALAAETDIQREAVQKEIQRAKNALNSAFHNSSMAEQEQLGHMQTQLQNITSMGQFE